tara:strand:- start:1351 stop:1797 length:447 start_codon:yes stop_codon:yes gene_type:complete
MDIRKMNSNEVDEYNKRCDVIKGLILTIYTNTIFEFIINPDTLYIEVMINDNSKISLLPNNTWGEVKRHIDKKIIGFTGDCIICCEKMENAVSCAKCSNNFCGKCYIELFKLGKGIITCPHCRYSFGEKIPEYKIEIYVDQIKRSLGK